MKKIISIILSILLVLSVAGNTYLLVDKKNAKTQLDEFEMDKTRQLATLNEKIDQAQADLLAETEKYNQALDAIEEMDAQAQSLHQEIDMISLKLTETETAAANAEKMLLDAKARSEEDEKLLTDKAQEVEQLMALIEDKDNAYSKLSGTRAQSG